MSEISIDWDQLKSSFANLDRRSADLTKTLSTFASEADGGVASEQIALIVRAVIEASQLAANSSEAIVEVARVAANDQLVTEEEILASLKALTVDEDDDGN